MKTWLESDNTDMHRFGLEGKAGHWLKVQLHQSLCWRVLGNNTKHQIADASTVWVCVHMINKACID